MCALFSPEILTGWGCEGVKKYGGYDVCNDLIGQRGRQELLVPLGS